jgi:hypothetical protein
MPVLTPTRSVIDRHDQCVSPSGFGAADSNAPNAPGQWPSLVGFVAIHSSTASLVLFIFRGECFSTEMSRNPAGHS